MTPEELQQKIKESKQALHSCMGSGCLDEAGTYVSIMAYAGMITATWKQKAYQVQVGAIQAGDAIGKAEALMKSSDEYREFLIFNSLCEALLENIRNLRAKAKGDESEKIMS